MSYIFLRALLFQAQKLVEIIGIVKRPRNRCSVYCTLYSISNSTATILYTKQTDPSIRLHTQGNPRRYLDTTVEVMISPVQERKARRSTAHDNFRSFTMSRPRPARVRITVRAIFLKYQRYSDNISSSISEQASISLNIIVSF